MFLGEFDYRADERGRAHIPPRLRREPKERAVLKPGAEKYTATHTLSGWKKQVVCNFLVKMRFDGFKSRSQISQKAGSVYYPICGLSSGFCPTLAANVLHVRIHTKVTQNNSPSMGDDP